MITKTRPSKELSNVKKYEVQYPVSAYTLPQEAKIHLIRFDDDYLNVELQDGRKLSIPLPWIPTLYHASPAEREKYEINPGRTMIIWDPDKCAINDEVRISDYLAPVNQPQATENV